LVSTVTDIIFKSEGGLAETSTKCIEELRKESPNYFYAGFYFGKAF